FMSRGDLPSGKMVGGGRRARGFGWRAAIVVAMVVAGAARPRGAAAAVVAYQGFDYPPGTPGNALSAGGGFSQFGASLSARIAAGAPAGPSGRLRAAGDP